MPFGTQSEAGSRFVKTMLLVIETCRHQRRNVFIFCASYRSPSCWPTRPLIAPGSWTVTYQYLLPVLDRLVNAGVAVLLSVHATRRSITTIDGIAPEKSAPEIRPAFAETMIEWSNSVGTIRLAGQATTSPAHLEHGSPCVDGARARLSSLSRPPATEQSPPHSVERTDIPSQNCLVLRNRFCNLPYRDHRSLERLGVTPNALNSTTRVP